MPKDVHILPVSVRLSLGRSSVLTIVHLPNPQKVGNASVAIPGVERKFKNGRSFPQPDKMVNQCPK
jgi:hypothetical protein